MATKTVNARNYTKADFDRRLRYLSDSQELAKLLNEMSEPYPYYVFRAKQLSFLPIITIDAAKLSYFAKSMVAIVRLPHRKGHFMISCMH